MLASGAPLSWHHIARRRVSRLREDHRVRLDRRATRSRRYGYDEVGRLTLAVTDSSSTPAQSYSYTTGTNQLASFTDASGTRTIAYDDRGNTLSETRPGGVTVAAEYDGYGRLIGYDRTGAGASDFVYNGLDDRVLMALDTAGIRRFVYDADGRVMGEYGTSASDVKAEFIWALPQVGAAGPFGGGDGLGGYMPLAVATPDTTGQIQLNWVHANHLGVPLVVTGAGGGLPITPDDYLAPGFPGQTRVFADLYYNRYRDYDPITGRYIQADPIGLAGGSNPFLYANGNPVNVVDPDGKNPIIAAVVVGAIIAGLIDLDLQLIEGRSIYCIDWNGVGFSAGVGGLTGGIGGYAAPFIGRGFGWVRGGFGRGGAYPKNVDLIKSIAGRADAYGARNGFGNGARAGTKMHSYAEKLLMRYQRINGDRGLSAEVTYLNGQPWIGGSTRGSVRLDVVDGPIGNPIAIYDYKFGGAVLTGGRAGQIRAGAGVADDIPVIQVKP